MGRRSLAQLQIPELVAANRVAAAARTAQATGRVRGLGLTARAERRRDSPAASVPVRKSRRLEGLGTVVTYNENDPSFRRRVAASLSTTTADEGPASRSLDPVALDAVNLADDDASGSAADAIPAARRAAISAFVARAVVAASPGTGVPDRRQPPSVPDRRRTGAVAKSSSTMTKVAAAEAEAPVVVGPTFWQQSRWRLDDNADIAKVVKERIYRMAFLPRSDRIVLAAGDKAGYLGLWDVAADERSGAETDLLLFRPQRSVISAILVSDQAGAAQRTLVRLTRRKVRRRTRRDGAPSSQASDVLVSGGLVTGSYDGTVRLLDLTTLQATVLAATEDADTMITGVDSKDGRSVLYCDGAGGVGRCDLRERTTTTTTTRSGQSASASGPYHVLHDRKISHLDIHPLQHHLFATASVDRTVRLWDWRGSLRKPLAEMVHGLAVNSAYFSPGAGTALLTTSYDDYVRVFDVSKLVSGETAGASDPPCVLAAPHGNQTGRWVTGFRATWLPWTVTGAGLPPSSSAFVIGSMQRQMDVMSASTGKLMVALASSGMTTIPAVTVAHPTLPVIAGGVASGRCYLFRSVK